MKNEKITLFVALALLLCLLIGGCSSATDISSSVALASSNVTESLSPAIESASWPISFSYSSIPESFGKYILKLSSLENIELQQKVKSENGDEYFIIDMLYSERDDEQIENYQEISIGDNAAKAFTYSESYGTVVTDEMFENPKTNQSVLLWNSDGREFKIFGTITQEQAIEIAQTITFH